MDNQFCLGNLEIRSERRMRYPGACALEYENIMKVVKSKLIGWNFEKNKGEKGIFGIPIAFSDSCEEQGRNTLHSHIIVWIQEYNTVRDLIFDDDPDVKKKSKKGITRLLQTNSSIYIWRYINMQQSLHKSKYDKYYHKK